MHELAARLPWLSAGLGMLGLAVALAALRTRHRPTQVFALFLVVRAVSLPDMQFIVHDTATAFRLANVDAVAEISLAFIALVFVAVYPQPRAVVRDRPALAYGVPALVAGLLLLYFIDPSLFVEYSIDTDGTLEEAGLGPLSLFWNIQLVVYAVLGWIFARDAFDRPPGPMRTGLILIAVGFSALSLYHGPSVGLGLVRSAIGLEAVPDAYLLWGRVLAASTAVFGGMALFELARHYPSAARGDRRVLVAAFGLYGAAAASGVVIGALGLWDTPVWTSMGADDLAQGLWRAAMPVMVTYALVRHRVFAIDLSVKWTIRQGTLVVAALAAVLLAREAAHQAGLDSLATVLGLVTVGVFAVVTLKVYRVADRVADAAMPTVERSAGYLDRRRLEVYQAALEDAIGDDGELSDGASERLGRLRARLGIADRDHEILMVTLNAGRGRSGAVGPIPGRTFLGRFRIDRLLGEGGHGTAYLAYDLDVERPVVIKAVRPEIDAQTVLQEARAMGAVQHANVATIFGVERVGPRVFVIVEYMANGSLADSITEGPLGTDRFLSVGSDLLAGLAAIHDAGIVHRDVKPSNVLLTRQGLAKVADFGVAQAVDDDGTLAPTAAGPAMGTVMYMAPEHARGRPVTAASDLFSAGATLYEAYMGVPYLAPFPGETATELRMRAAAAGAFDAELEGPDELRSWFERAMAPRPDDRFGSAQEMREALVDAFQRTG